MLSGKAAKLKQDGEVIWLDGWLPAFAVLFFPWQYAVAVTNVRLQSRHDCFSFGLCCFFVAHFQHFHYLLQDSTHTLERCSCVGSQFQSPL